MVRDTVYANLYEEWDTIIKLLKSSGKDLSKIKLTCKEGMWNDSGRDKSSSEDNYRRADKTQGT